MARAHDVDPIAVAIKPLPHHSHLVIGYNGLGPISIKGTLQLRQSSGAKPRTIEHLRIIFEGLTYAYVREVAEEKVHVRKMLRLRASKRDGVSFIPVKPSRWNEHSYKSKVVLPAGKTKIPFSFELTADDDLPASCIVDRDSEKGTLGREKTRSKVGGHTLYRMIVCFTVYEDNSHSQRSGHSADNASMASTVVHDREEVFPIQYIPFYDKHQLRRFFIPKPHRWWNGPGGGSTNLPVSYDVTLDKTILTKDDDELQLSFRVVPRRDGARVKDISFVLLEEVTVQCSDGVKKATATGNTTLFEWSLAEVVNGEFWKERTVKLSIAEAMAKINPTSVARKSSKSGSHSERDRPVKLTHRAMVTIRLKSPKGISEILEIPITVMSVSRAMADIVKEIVLRDNLDDDANASEDNYSIASSRRTGRTRRTYAPSEYSDTSRRYAGNSSQGDLSVSTSQRIASTRKVEEWDGREYYAPSIAASEGPSRRYDHNANVPASSSASVYQNNTANNPWSPVSPTSSNDFFATGTYHFSPTAPSPADTTSHFSAPTAASAHVGGGGSNSNMDPTMQPSAPLSPQLAVALSKLAVGKTPPRRIDSRIPSVDRTSRSQTRTDVNTPPPRSKSVGSVLERRGLPQRFAASAPDEDAVNMIANGTMEADAILTDTDYRYQQQRGRVRPSAPRLTDLGNSSNKRQPNEGGVDPEVLASALAALAAAPRSPDSPSSSTQTSLSRDLPTNNGTNDYLPQQQQPHQQQPTLDYPQRFTFENSHIQSRPPASLVLDLPQSRTPPPRTTSKVTSLINPLSPPPSAPSQSQLHSHHLHQQLPVSVSPSPIPAAEKAAPTSLDDRSSPILHPPSSRSPDVILADLGQNKVALIPNVRPSPRGASRTRTHSQHPTSSNTTPIPSGTIESGITPYLPQPKSPQVSTATAATGAMMMHPFENVPSAPMRADFEYPSSPPYSDMSPQQTDGDFHKRGRIYEGSTPSRTNIPLKTPTSPNLSPYNNANTITTTNAAHPVGNASTRPPRPTSYTSSFYSVGASSTTVNAGSDVAVGSDLPLGLFPSAFNTDLKRMTFGAEEEGTFATADDGSGDAGADVRGTNREERVDSNAVTQTSGLNLQDEDHLLPKPKGTAHTTDMEMAGHQWTENPAFINVVSDGLQLESLGSFEKEFEAILNPNGNGNSSHGHGAGSGEGEGGFPVPPARKATLSLRYSNNRRKGNSAGVVGKQESFAPSLS
ncbi:hypothetical protein HK102_000784 [Quaeritorhiza haematococci]|nr:hypothetical protein HK102_000784 [Quaeritorhiza haematococci]